MRPMGFRDPAVKHVLKNKRPNGTREVRLIIAPSINGGDQLADGNSSLDCNQPQCLPVRLLKAQARILSANANSTVMKRTCRECQNQLLNSCGMAAASVSNSPAKWLGGRGGDGSPVSKPAVVKQRAVIDWVWSYELYPPIARADYSISPKLFLNV